MTKVRRSKVAKKRVEAGNQPKTNQTEMYMALMGIQNFETFRAQIEESHILELIINHWGKNFINLRLAFDSGVELKPNRKEENHPLEYESNSSEKKES